MDISELIILGLIVVVIGGLVLAMLPYLNGSARAEQRQKTLLAGKSATRVGGGDRVQDAANRRKQVADSIKELDAKARNRKRISFETRMSQAGLTWSKQKFYLISAVLGSIVTLGIFMATKNPLYALAGAPIGGLGLPRWIIGFVRKRRMGKFNAEFPNAVDVIIRGIKAGLPLGDCLRIIASEAVEPVRTEFRRVVEAQTLGLTMSEAVDKLPENIPTAEANFFSIVINIQQKAGGNLSEALGNLSRVLRDRKKMALKVKAMSAEAKASAGIIGALPFLVAGLVYLSSPRYMEILWLTPSGRMVMAVSGFWMFIGLMSMRKMINFDM